MTPIINPTASRRRAAAQRGSTLIVVLLVVSVLSVIAGGLLVSATARYHSTYQSASWQEALIGAEAGVDLAMNELRKQVTDPNGTAFANWSKIDGKGQTYADKGRVFPSNDPQSPLLLKPLHGGEGNSLLGTRVFIDVPGADAPPTPNTSFAQPPPATVDPFINERKDGVPADGTIRYWYRIRALGYAGVSGPAPPPKHPPPHPQPN